MIEKGGLYINGAQEKEDKKTDENSLLEDRIMIIRLGKSSFRIIEVIPDDEEAIQHDRVDIEAKSI